MGLNIGRKLDFLMRLSGTQNSVLGKALSFDASYVSRIRSGKRTLPRNRNLIIPIAAFFARSIDQESQTAVLAKRICPEEPWPDLVEERTKLLARWLADTKNIMDEDVSDLLELDIQANLKNAYKQEKPSGSEVVEFFYGNAGRRQGVERFLAEAYEADEQVTLLLHSDESMEWLYEDPDFVKDWSKLLMGILEKGGKIKMIHTLRRNIEEMMEAIRKWVPIYMTGRIETYYCPRIRDNIYRRTLFIAQHHAALVSHSIVNTKSAMVNLLIRDKSAVNALEDEFFDFLGLCRPLIRVFNTRNVEDFLHTYSEFTKADDNTIMLRSLPSRCTMPECVNESMAERIKHAIFKQETDRLCARFRSHLDKGHHVTEILQLKSIDVVRETLPPIPFRDILGQPELRYTVSELCRHYENIIEMMERYSNYHVFLFQSGDSMFDRKYLAPFDTSIPHMENIMLTVKEQTGVLMYNAGVRTTAFFTDDMESTLSFWDYLYRFTEGEDRKRTIGRLRTYIEELSEGNTP